ncbi:TonB-dependent receptor [Hymenobacter tenuis]
MLERKVTLQAEAQTIESVLSQLEKQLQVQFVYSPQLIDAQRRISLRVTNKPLAQVLDELLAPRKVAYEVRNNRILLSQPKNAKAAELRGDSRSQTTQAQADVSVSGRVVESGGQALPGVTIIVKGTTIGTTTDSEGRFSLTIPVGSVLQFSFIGYSPQEISVREAGVGLNIVLQENSEALKEVVVVGYGTLDKKEVTSAITHVDSRELLTVGSVNPLMSLQGKVAGLTIANSSAADPNAQPSIQLRGVSSREAGLGPLIVINGVPGGILENINQNDIESIDVLKGGAASAIYGTRGSNGVIIVTTKKGNKEGGLEYNAYTTFDKLTMEPTVLTADQFIEQGRGTNFGAKTDWLKEITREQAFAHKHTLTASGGSDNSNYRVTADYRDAEGIDLRSGRQEYGARLALNHIAASKLYSIGINFAPRYYTSRNADYNAYQQALTLNPTTPVRSLTDPTRYYRFQSGYDNPYNPVERLATELSGTEGKFLDYNASLKLNLLPTLSTQITWGQFTRDYFDFFFRPSTSTYAAQNEGGMNSASRNYNKSDQRSLEWIGNYALDVNQHSLQLLAGYSYQYFTDSGISISNRDMPSDALTYNNIGSGLYNQEEGRTGFGSFKSDSKLIAFFGRVNYSFHDKYLVSASLRREGSSKFGYNHKWGYFPAVSLGWRIKEEGFMQGLSWVNDLKLRADYGVTGNQDFGSYRSLDVYSGAGYYPLNGTYFQVWGPNQNTNYDLRWERAENLNYGVDFSVFDNKLSGSVNYYTRRNTDLLGSYAVQVPPNIQGSTFANVGTMENSGVEVQLSAPVVKTPDFTYSLAFAGATNNNKFVSFSNDVYQGQTFVDAVYMPGPGTPGSAQRLQEGQRIGTFYMLKSAGVSPFGKLQVYNQKGEIIDADKANTDDRQVVGNGLPKYTLSLTNTFGYKNFDASIFLRGSLGFKVFNTRAFYLGTPSTQAEANVLASAYSDSKYALLNNPATSVILSDYFLEDGGFVKLDNVSVGYNLKFNSKYARSMRVYAAARNLVTFTRFKGGDPDMNPVNGLYPGVRGTRDYYPATTQLLLGVQFGL